MTIYAITFRLADDSSYAERYNSVVAAIRQESSSTYWDEPTSFALIESEKANSKAVADSIDRNSTLNTGKDLLLVVNLTQKGYTPLGVVHDNDLDTLMKRR